jgi:hypothetical protein
MKTVLWAALTVAALPGAWCTAGIQVTYVCMYALYFIIYCMYKAGTYIHTFTS